MSKSQKSSYQPEFGESGSISGRISSGANIQMKDITSKADSKAPGSNGLSGFINNEPAKTISQSKASGKISNPSTDGLKMEPIDKIAEAYNQDIEEVKSLAEKLKIMPDNRSEIHPATDESLESESYHDMIKYFQYQNDLLNNNLDDEQMLIEELEKKIEEGSLSRDDREDMWRRRRVIYFKLRDLDHTKKNLSQMLKHMQKMLAQYDWSLYKVHIDCIKILKGIGESRKAFIGKNNQELELLSKQSAKVGMIIQDKGDLQCSKDEINEEHNKINKEFDKIQARKNALTKRLDVMHKALNPDDEFK